MPKHGGWEPTGFADRLRTAREGLGLTQQELADKAGCNKFTIAKLERGTQEPAWPLVLALAAALGVDCTAFTQQPDEGEPPGPGRPRKDAGLAVGAEPAADQAEDAPPAKERSPGRRGKPADQAGPKKGRRKGGGK